MILRAFVMDDLTSETSVILYQTIRHNNPEGIHFLTMYQLFCGLDRLMRTFIKFCLLHVNLCLYSTNMN